MTAYRPMEFESLPSEKQNSVSEAVDENIGANREGEERYELCLISAEFVVLHFYNDAWLECVSSCSLLWSTSIRQVLCTRVSV